MLNSVENQQAELFEDQVEWPLREQFWWNGASKSQTAGDWGIVLKMEAKNVDYSLMKFGGEGNDKEGSATWGESWGTNEFIFILFLILAVSDPQISHLLPWNDLKCFWLSSNQN